MKHLTLSLTLTMAIIWAAQTGRGPGVLSIARQGYLFAGGKYSDDNNRVAMSGQLYVEFQIR